MHGNHNNASATRRPLRQSPSQARRRQLCGRSPRIAPQSLNAATKSTTTQQQSPSPPQQSQQHTKGHFGRQHHSMRPSAWTIPVVEDDDDEYQRVKGHSRPLVTIANLATAASASAISDDDDDDDETSTDSLPSQHDTYDAPLAVVTPDRLTPCKSNLAPTTVKVKSTAKHQVVIKRSLHNSRRKQKLHSITPMRRPNVHATSSAESHQDYFPYHPSQFQQETRGNGVVLDLTTLFVDPLSPGPKSGPLSPTETATTAASTQQQHQITAARSNLASTLAANAYNAPTPPWKHQHQNPRSTPHSPGSMPPHPSTHDHVVTITDPHNSGRRDHVDLQWDTKSQSSQEALSTERQSQALTQWLNFVLVGEQQLEQQQQLLHESDRPSTGKHQQRRRDGRSLDGMASMIDDGASTVMTKTPTGRSVTSTPSRARTTVTITPTVCSDQTTPIKNPFNDNSSVSAVVVKRRSHRRLSMFQYAQSFEHAQETAHHWFHHSAQWKELRVRIRCELASGKMQLREDRDLYANIGCREQLLDMFLSYRPAWLTMALEVVMNDSILPNQQQVNQLGHTTLPSTKQLKQFIVQKVLSDSKLLAKYNQGRGSNTPSGKFEIAYHDELRPLVLYRILVLIFFLDRAAIKFQALKSHNNDLGNLFHSKTKLQVKSTQQMLVIFCREFLSRQGDIIKQLARVNLLVYYKQDILDEIDYPIVNFAIDLRDGVRLCRVLELLWLLPRQKTFYAHNNINSNGGKNGIDLRAKYPLLSQLRIPAISRLQKIHNVNVALAALQDDCQIGLPQELQAHHIVDGQRRMVLRLVWTIVFMHCFDSHSKVLSREQLEAEIAHIQALRRHHYIMRERRRHREEIKQHCSLALMQETGAAQNISLVGVNDYQSLLSPDGTSLATKAQKSPKPSHPSLSLSISGSSSFDGDQSYSSNLPLEDMPVIQQWKGLLFQWCQQVCMIVEELERDDRLPTGGTTPLKTTSSLQWTTSELTNGKALCCLIHHYHPTLLTREDLRLSSTLVDEPPSSIQTSETPTSRFRVTRQQQKSHKVSPDYYVRLAQRRLVEIGGIPPMMLVPLAADENGNRRKPPPVLSLADEKSILVFLYHVCARLMESRQQVKAVIFVQQRYRYIQSVELLRKQQKAAKTIWMAWMANKDNYYRSQDEKYRGAVRVLEAFVTRHFDKLLFLRKVRLDREEQNLAATPIQAQVRKFLAVKHSKMLREQYSAAVVIQSRYRRFRDYASYQLILCESIPAVTNIQRHWRGYVQRRRYGEVIYAVINLQSFTRGAVVVRKRWMRLWRNGATHIQRIWRGFRVQLQYQLDLLDIILVQSTVRKHQAEKLAKMRRASVLVVQRMSRGWLARTFFAKLRRETAATIVIQTTCRRYLAIQAADRLRSLRAALVLQRSWRRAKFLLERCRASTKIQAQYRERLEHRKYCVLRIAAVKAQSLWRRHAERKTYLQRRLFIISIQSTFRRWKYGVVKVTERKHALIFIQKYIRQFLAQRLFEARKRHKAAVIGKAIICQALSRRNFCSRKWRRQRMAILTIQCQWRSIRRFQIFRRRTQLIGALSDCNILFRRRQKGTFRIVPHTRKVLQLSKQTQLRCGRKRILLSNATTWVPPWQGHRQNLFKHRSHIKSVRLKYKSGVQLSELPRRKLGPRAFQLVNEASMRLQRPWMHCIQCNSYGKGELGGKVTTKEEAVKQFERRSLFRRRRLLLETLQMLSNGGLSNADNACNESFRGAARRIQRASRAIIAQGRGKRNRQDLNLSRVLNLVRRNLKVTFRENSPVLVNKFDPFRETALSAVAATVIQKIWRGYCSVSKRKATACSVLILQCQIRSWAARRSLARKKANKLISENERAKEEANYAAALLQSIARGRMVRKEMNMLQDSAVIVQKTVRMYIVRVAYRAVINRRRVQIEMAKQTQSSFDAALTIQRAYQSTLATSDCRTNPKKAIRPHSVVSRRIKSKEELENRAKLTADRMKAALIAQRLWRGFRCRCEFMLTYRSLITIQAWWRSRYQSNWYKGAVDAAILLQSLTRGIVARLKLQKPFTKVLSSIVAFQALARGVQTRRKMLSRAAVDIQRYVRGFLARQLISLQRFAATAIQKTWRCYADATGYIFVIVATIKLQGFLRMVRAKMRRKELLQQNRRIHDATIKLQSLWRRLASRKIASELLRIRRAAISLQSFMRMLLARRRATQVRLHESIASTKVQSIIRMGLELRRHRKQQVAAVKIQSLYRGVLARKLLRHWKQEVAAIQIQSLHRRQLARKLRDHVSAEKLNVISIDQAIREELKESDDNRREIAELASEHPATTRQNGSLRHEHNLSRKRPPSSPKFAPEEAARVIQTAVRRMTCLQASKRVFHRRLSLSQGVVRGWIARKQSNPEVQKSIVLIKEAELRSKLHPNMRLGARLEQALKILKTSSSLHAIMNVVTTIELATRFSPECCYEFVQADATTILVPLLLSCNKSLPHVELLFYIMQTLLNVCKHRLLIQYVATVETAEAFLYLIRMYGAEESVFCSAVALLDLCMIQSEDIRALVAAPPCKNRMESVYNQWKRKLRHKQTPSQACSTPQFLVKRSKAKTDMLILGISYDLERGVSVLEQVLLRTM